MFNRCSNRLSPHISYPAACPFSSPYPQSTRTGNFLFPWWALLHLFPPPHKYSIPLCMHYHPVKRCMRVPPSTSPLPPRSPAPPPNRPDHLFRHPSSLAAPTLYLCLPPRPPPHHSSPFNLSHLGRHLVEAYGVSCHPCLHQPLCKPGLV